MPIINGFDNFIKSVKTDLKIAHGSDQFRVLSHDLDYGNSHELCRVPPVNYFGFLK